MRWAIGVWLFISAAVDADECEKTGDECQSSTGKSCKWFFQKCDPGTTCVNGDCVCPSNKCAVNGICKTTVTTTAAPDDSQCLQAYKDRCFEQEPYAMQCCSQCNQGSTQDVCSWSFEENEPTLSFGGEFAMENAACAELCDMLNQQKTSNHEANNRYDYCPDANIQVLAKKCPPGAKSLQDNVPNDLCEKKIEAKVECSWKYTRVESASKCGGDKSTSFISGSFIYSYEDHETSGDCELACKALSDMNAEPASFCSAGSIHNLVSKCPAAQKSLEQAPTPQDWCGLTFTEPPKAVANTGNVCDDAFRNDCWKQGAFKKCCENCYEDAGYATCDWSFKGPSVFDGDKCILDATQLTASFRFDSRECFTACSDLSTKIKEPQDLCAGSAFRMGIDGCAAAKASVEAVLTKTSWCSANQTTKQDASQMKALLLVADNQCEAAYQKRCYEKTSFSQCCAKCSDGEQEYKCHWNFHENTKDFNMGDVFSGLNSQACENACKLLNNAGNERTDYCPGSALYTAAEACPGALESLRKKVPPGFCKHKDKAEVNCAWQYSFEGRKAAEGDTPTDTAGGNLTGSIKGSFPYSPDSKECKQACAALGYNNNLPSVYCDGPSHVWETVDKCAAAMTSLRTQLGAQPELAKQWCESTKIRDNDRVNFYFPAETVNPPVDPKCTSSKNLHLCDASFNQRCYNSSAGQKGPGRKLFNQCCADCFQARAKNRCEWSLETAEAKLHGKFEYLGRSLECFDGCNSINGLKQVSDLCPNTAFGQKLQKCIYAWSKGVSPATAFGRGSVKNSFCKSGLMQSECNLPDPEMDKYCGSDPGDWEKHPPSLLMMGVGNVSDSRSGAWVAVAFTAIAAAAFMVYKSRRPQDLDGYVHAPA